MWSRAIYGIFSFSVIFGIYQPINKNKLQYMVENMHKSTVYSGFVPRETTYIEEMRQYAHLFTLHRQYDAGYTV